jgi:hypothetical protein
VNDVHLVLFLGPVCGDVRSSFVLLLSQIDYDVIWEIATSCDI